MKRTEQNVFPPELVLVVAENLPQNRPGSVLSHVGTAPATIKVEFDVTNADDSAAVAELEKATNGRTIVVPVFDFEENGTNGENLEQVTFDNLTNEQKATLPSIPGLGRTFAVRAPN